jgi:hypothetical protein
MRASGPAKRRGLLLLPDTVVGLDNTLAISRQEFCAKYFCGVSVLATTVLKKLSQ